MEKFRKLTPQKRVGALNAIFGERGGEVASVLVEAGVEGWKSINAETAKAVPVNEKINQQMETTRAKLEAIQGSLTNLVATGFTPMLNTVKPMLDLTNSLVGEFQEFGATYPGIASVATHLFGVSSALLAGYTGVRALTTSWKLWRIASTVGASEQSLLTFLRNVRTDATNAGTAIENAGTKTGRLRGAVGGVGSIAAALGVALAIDQLVQLKTEIDSRANEIEELKKKSGEVYRLYFPEKWKLIQAMQGGPTTENESSLRALAAKEAVDVGEKYNVNQQLELSLDVLKPGSLWKNFWYQEKPFTDASVVPVFGNRYDPKVASGKLFELDHRLIIPEVMKEFVRGLHTGTVLPNVSREGRERVEQTLAISPEFGDTYRKAVAELANEALMLQGKVAPVGESLNILNLALYPLPTSVSKTTVEFDKVIPPISKFPTLINNAGDAAQNFTNRLNNLLLNVTPATGGTGGTTTTGAAGGTTTSGPPSLLSPLPTVRPRPSSPVELKKSHASLSSFREMPLTPQLKTLSLLPSDGVARNRESSSRQSDATPRSVHHVNRRNYIYINESSNPKVTADTILRELKRREARS
jgi:hypothetical protein